MSFDDDEILQDFLVEAGEIIELLSEQLVDLEQRPEDSDLLNAIFRGFHTVKGGAGFLQLNPLVDCCHVAENVFDILRNGQRHVTPELMDVVLQALDAVNEMFEAVRQGIPPEPAEPALLQSLEVLAVPESESPPPVVEETPAAVPEPVIEQVVAPEPEITASAEEAASEFANKSGDITDEEFEQLLNALDGDAPTSAPESSPSEESVPESSVSEEIFDAFEDVSAEPAASTNDDITEDEFEALLDQLQGKAAPSQATSEAVPDTIKEEPAATAKAEEPASADDDLINDSEFEELLDQLHGKGAIGNAPDSQNEKQEAAPVSEPVSTPAPQAEEKTQPAQKPEPVKAAVAPVEKAPAPAKPVAPRGDKDNAPAAAEATVRVDTKRLDDIMNMVGELVLVRNRLVRLGHKSADEVMAKAVANLDVVTGDLQAAVMKTRMQPIKKVFGRFPRVVRDLARSLKKEVNLELQGEETDLDKNLVEALADPLVHLVRNSVDHGVESPDVREANGKPRVGTVVLAAEQEGDHILLIIDDDGAGMDANTLRQKSVEKGLLDHDAADRLSDKECFNLIFMPGFSTKDEISDVSGRGVGMDVVKTKITQLNGIIDIDSEKGRGTRITIKVPLTLAIMPTLMVMLQDQAFAFPLVSVNEIFHLDLTKTNVVDGKEVVVVREKAIPLFHLKRWLVTSIRTDEPSESAHVVVVSVGTQRVGFVVDQLIGQEEVVIKPLGTMLHGTAGMAGATITGDGRIALILDVPSMLGRYA